MPTEIVQNHADLTYAFKICRSTTPWPHFSLTVGNFRKAQATPLCSSLCKMKRQTYCFDVKRYAVRNAKIRPYAVRKFKMKEYAVRKGEGCHPQYVCCVFCVFYWCVNLAYPWRLRGDWSDNTASKAFLRSSHGISLNHLHTQSTRYNCIIHLHVLEDAVHAS